MKLIENKLGFVVVFFIRNVKNRFVAWGMKKTASTFLCPSEFIYSKFYFRLMSKKIEMKLIWKMRKEIKYAHALGILYFLERIHTRQNPE